MSHIFLVALLSFFAHVPEPQASRIAANRVQIEASVAESERVHGVPPAVMLTVAWLESHLGTAPGSGGCWGAPVSATRRQTAGTPLQAARVLARGYEHCHHDWRQAVGFFRSGLCNGGRHPAYVATASRLVRRLSAATHTPVPAGF